MELSNNTFIFIALIVIILVLAFLLISKGKRNRAIAAEEVENQAKQHKAEIFAAKAKLRKCIINAYKYKNVDFDRQELFEFIIESIEPFQSNIMPINDIYLSVSRRVDKYFQPAENIDALEAFFDTEVLFNCNKNGRNFALNITSGRLDLSRFQDQINTINVLLRKTK